MGHKYNPDSKRQQRMRIVRCAYCHKGSAHPLVRDDNGQLRHKKCLGMSTPEPEQPENILEAYRFSWFRLNDDWRQRVRDFREFRGRTAEPGDTIEKLARMFEASQEAS